MAERGPVETHVLFQKAFNAGDVQGLMALYEPEAILIPQPGAEPIRGIQAIRSALEGFLALKGKVELQTRHVVQHGDIALLRSAWWLKGTGPDEQPVEMPMAAPRSYAVRLTEGGGISSTTRSAPIDGWTGDPAAGEESGWRSSRRYPYWSSSIDSRRSLCRWSRSTARNSRSSPRSRADA